MLIYLVAGEASGDALGARLMAALRSRRPDLGFAGIGGEQMARHGLASLFPMRDLALMGLLEVLPRLCHLRRRLHQTVADIAARRPDVVVTIDSPGFTLRLLRAIQTSRREACALRRAAGLGLARAPRAALSRTVGPSCSACCRSNRRSSPRHGLPATFVGHPVLESGADQGDAARFRTSHGIDPSTRVLTLMPGSRRTEVARLLPILGATLQRLPDVVPVVPLAGPVAEAVRAGTRDWPRQPMLVTEPQDKHDAFAASAVALTKSGTSTLELAMAGVPMVVTYRVNPLTAAIARRLITVRYGALVNLLAEREVVPELIQQACTPDRLAVAVRTLLDDPAAAAAQRAACRDVLASLRPPAGMPSDAAAAAVLDLLDQP